MEEVLKQRAQVENELKELRRQFMDKARTARSFRIQVENLEGLAALSRNRYNELERLRTRIEESESDLREIQRLTAERKKEFDRLGKVLRERRTNQEAA
ncbi:MAG: hypothetical protein R3282_00530 [Rhodothermales bacterium]|nr:hypothetical protein [Rhodothermales bacterium]